jgi:hypothetical protein
MKYCMKSSKNHKHPKREAEKAYSGKGHGRKDIRRRVRYGERAEKTRWREG